jgi:Zn-dependent protease with chaperone function
MQGVFVLLVALSLAATLLGGFAKAPWWFWLVGAAALALLIATDPNRLRASYADTRGLDTVPLLLGDLKSLSIGCLMSAAAFALGVALSWLLRL